LSNGGKGRGFFPTDEGQRIEQRKGDNRTGRRERRGGGQCIGKGDKKKKVAFGGEKKTAPNTPLLMEGEKGRSLI